MSEAAQNPAPEATGQDTQQTPANDNATGTPQTAANSTAQPTQAQADALEQAAADGTLSLDELTKLMSGRKVPMKVNGKDRLVDAGQFLRLAQIGYGGFQKATTLERGLRDFEAAFEADPVEALDRWAAKNPKIAAALEARAAREQRLYSASPEERKRIEQEFALEDRERRIKEAEARQEAEKKQAEEAAKEAKAKQEAAQWSRVYGQAMTDAGIDADDQAEAYDMILRRHQAALDQGYVVKPGHVVAMAKKVAEHFDALAARRAKKWAPDALEERLGKEKLREFQRREAEKVRSPRDVNGQFRPTTPPEQQEKPRQKVRYGNSMASWQKAREEARRGK
jgi:hypothetical protein